jgi:hypothetical protein
MTWVKIDDRFPEHPKIAEAGPLAMALQVAALCYASRNLTDGFIPSSMVGRLLPLEEWLANGQQTPSKLLGGPTSKTLLEETINALCDVGLWEKSARGGYEIHDYLDHQRSRSEVDKIKKVRARAGHKGGKTKAKVEGEIGLANGKQNSKQLASRLLAVCQKNVEAKGTPDPDPDPDQEKERDSEVAGPTSETPIPNGTGPSPAEPSVPTKTESPFLPDARALADYFADALLKVKPDGRLVKGGAQRERWVAIFERMLRIDQRKPDRARGLIDWVTRHEFWAANVLSAEKLRQQYDRLELVREREATAPRGGRRPDPGPTNYRPLGEGDDSE